MEIWKETDFKDYYISNLGNLKKENYRSRKHKTNLCCIVKPHVKENGYLQATMYDKINKKSCHYYIHRLVAKAFIPNPNNYPCINHKDSNKKNNNVDNLEWCTYKQNMQHASKNGLIKRKYGKENKHSKCYVELDENYNFIKKIIGTRQEGRENGFSREKVARVARHEVYMTKEKKIYFYAEEYYSKNILELKKEHEEKVKKHYKLKYKNKKINNKCSNSVSGLILG